MNNRLVLLSLIVVLSGCASSGPQTQYYSFFASDEAGVVSPSNTFSSSIGIGPVKIPEYMDNPAIVSLSASQKVRVSGYHAWAGGLKESIVRTMSAEFQQLLPNAPVSPFPWDARIRPKYQVQIQLSEFSGQRGGQVELSGRWVVIDQHSKASVLSGTERLSATAETSSVDDYVKSLNLLLIELSAKIASRISESTL